MSDPSKLPFKIKGVYLLCVEHEFTKCEIDTRLNLEISPFSPLQIWNDLSPPLWTIGNLSICFLYLNFNRKRCIMNIHFIILQHLHAKFEFQPSFPLWHIVFTNKASPTDNYTHRKNSCQKRSQFHYYKQMQPAIQNWKNCSDPPRKEFTHMNIAAGTPIAQFLLGSDKTCTASYVFLCNRTLVLSCTWWDGNWVSTLGYGGRLSPTCY